MSSTSRQQLEEWLGTIDLKADRVLDVGGADNSVGGRVRSWNVKEYKILDLPSSHKSKSPDIVCDLNDETFPIILMKQGKFDVVFCLEVFEYIWNPVDALYKISYLMHVGAMLYISFQFAYPIHEPAESDYMRYTKFGAEKLLKEAGFNIVENTHRVSEQGKHALSEFHTLEGMRYKGARRTGTQFDTGYLIKARKM